MSSELVSVVLCGYNQKDFVRDAIQSVLNQTHSHLELVVIDNGSTDGSPEVIKECVSRDPRVKIILHPQNDSISKRMNHGIENAQGEYISILYADDYYLPNYIERSLNCFKNLPSDYGVVYSPAYRLNIITGEKWINPSLTASGWILQDIFLNYIKEGYICPISPLIRKECYLRYRFHEDVFSEGEDIFLRIAIAYKFHYLAEPLVVMRDHLSNMGKAIVKNRELFLANMEKLNRNPEFPRALKPVFCDFVGRILRNYGWQGVRVAGNAKWARDCFWRAICWSPKQILHPRTIIGFGLALLPSRLLRGLNNRMNSLRRKSQKGNIAFKSEYT
jgi:glycosyltransferase involved in cell wall biosynthesis